MPEHKAIKVALVGNPKYWENFLVQYLDWIESKGWKLSWDNCR